jgi:Branched-chain amino acid transport system / permease component
VQIAAERCIARNPSATGQAPSGWIEGHRSLPYSGLGMSLTSGGSHLPRKGGPRKFWRRRQKRLSVAAVKRAGPSISLGVFCSGCPVTQTCSWWRVCLCRVVFERWGTTEDCSCSPRAHSRSRSSCETSDQLAFAATNAIAILGLNLIAGQAGLISLGHGAFYGLGAYTLAVLKRVADEHVGVKTHGLWPSTGALCFRIR